VGSRYSIISLSSYEWIVRLCDQTVRKQVHGICIEVVFKFYVVFPHYDAGFSY
jgi:hypothetical protein